MAQMDIRHLTFTYPQCHKAALDDVSFSVEQGEFLTVCGATGSGKSTLLRLLKAELTPLGDKSGEVFFDGDPLSACPPQVSASDIGFVMQRPEQQIVTDKVWHELAFGLENLGLPRAVIASRVAETASYFGIEDWFDRDTATLSGGQKQLLNLAAVMVTDPKVLILDEPTAQLDPIAASSFIATLQKLNRELSLTVIITEHRLEEIIPVSDRLLVLDGGRVTGHDTPAAVLSRLQKDDRLLLSMPTPSRWFHAAGLQGECPLTLSAGRAILERSFLNDIKTLSQDPCRDVKEPALRFRDVRFRYDRHGKDVLCGLDLTVNVGEIFCILGGNGAGKTTALSAAAGLVKPYSGRIEVFGKPLSSYQHQSLYRDCLAMLPQDVQTVFLKNTVAEELDDIGDTVKMLPFDVQPLLEKHPYDLSGGEQQLAALAKVLQAKPRLLLLDEPTKGLDSFAKTALAKILKRLKSDGMTIVAVTHDVEFAALCADRCALFFRGEAVSVQETHEFFADNRFYTTAAARLTRGYYDGIITVEEAAALCLQNGRKGGDTL